jgi:hypothetical protein
VGCLPGTAHFGGNIAANVIPNAGAPENAGAPVFYYGSNVSLYRFNQSQSSSPLWALRRRGGASAALKTWVRTSDVSGYLWKDWSASRSQLQPGKTQTLLPLGLLRPAGERHTGGMGKLKSILTNLKICIKYSNK